MKEGKIEYLGMLQNVISRMSSTSAIFKGFAATVITGIAAISATNINKVVLLLTVLPIISFLVLDVFYLRIERKFRYLYDQVQEDKREINFSMQLTTQKVEITLAKARIIDCLLSPSIWLFYLPGLLIVITIVILKFRGLI